MRGCIDVTCACCGRDWPCDDVWMVLIAGKERDVCPHCMGTCALCADDVEPGDVARVVDGERVERFRPCPFAPWQTRHVKVKRLAHAECVEQAEREADAIRASDEREAYWGDK